MTSILFFVIGSIIALGSFIGGLRFSKGLYYVEQTHALNKATEEKKPIRTLTDDEQREILKRQLEVKNFFDYNGDVQQRPEHLVHTRKG